MHRVLRPGGRAVIIDLSKDASQADINREVDAMQIGTVNRAITRFTFKHMLLKRAYGQDNFRRMAADSRFGHCEIHVESIALEVWLTRRQA